MSIEIDWHFIGAREGLRLSGYVPNPETSSSGVTIGAGVDLSAHTAESFSSLPSDLLAKLSPYFGLKTAAAVEALRERPLTITQDEADALNELARGQAVEALCSAYDSVSGVFFVDLPPRAQTVIASVAFQYGNLAKRCPRFWALAVKQDWPGLKYELEHFGDAYGSRRELEAQYLGYLATPPAPAASDA